MRASVPFEQDSKYCHYCQGFHYGEHAKFAISALDRSWRKYWPEAAIVQAQKQAQENEERLLTEEGVEPRD